MELKKIIEKEVLEMIDFLSDWNNIFESKSIHHISLMSGLPSIIILMIDYNRNFPNKQILGKIKSYTIKTFDILEKQNSLLTSYCAGLAGYGYFLLKIQKNTIFDDAKDSAIIEQINDILSQIDEILLEQINVDFLENNYDILHGYIGIGLYFIERDNATPVRKIINKLKEICKQKDSQIFWAIVTKDDYNSNNIDLGSAHGVASVLYFLSKIFSKGFVDKDLLTLIKGGLNFYSINSQYIADEIISYYPNLINFQEFIKSKNQPENSRLAWCYGDLGILYNIYKINILLGDKKASENTLSKLKITAKRNSSDEINKIDSGFCHGSSGIAVLYLDLYQISKSDIFLEAARRWTEISLSSKVSVSVSNSKYNFPNINKSQNYTLLEGFGGMLFSYMVFLNYDMETTKETLLLKY